MVATPVTIHLEPAMLSSARAGRFNFLKRLRGLLGEAGHDAEYVALDDRPAGLSLWHMQAPAGLAGALIFRRTYHYPFWHIEAVPQRWRWPVSRATFDPEAIDRAAAQAFTQKLRARVLPGPRPTSTGPALIALQGRLTEARSFQTMSPLDMLHEVGRAGIGANVTLHPTERYSAEERAALNRVLSQHPSLRLTDATPDLLRQCAFVITQNSAVAFDGYILGKAAVLFGQIDFHHIALNVADLGAGDALRRAPRHRPPSARYLDWFLRGHAIDAMAPDMAGQVIAALRRGGWPV